MKRSSSPAIGAWVPLLFFLSGISGLIYQVVWMRMLIRVFGITLYATSSVVAVFMGGLALGSWAMGRLLRTAGPTPPHRAGGTAALRAGGRRVPSLRLYAYIELAIAGSALVATAAMAALPGLYAGLAELPQQGGSLGAVAARLALAAVVLLVPTVLMGATLPLLVRWLARRDQEVGARLASLYGLNTFGAVLGIVFTGFFAIGVLGEWGSVLVGAALNLGIAAFLLAHPGGKEPAAGGSGAPDQEPAVGRSAGLFLGLAAVSGFCALAYEILWTRMLVLLMGSSVYAFSTMLAVYLAGIGLGSLAVVRLVDRVARPALVFGWSQVALAVLGALSFRLYGLLGAAAYDPKYLYSPLQGPGDLALFAAMGVAVILPVTLVLGMVFPLLGRMLSAGLRGSGSAVGSLYAWNTVGGVAGALAAGLLLVPWLGTQTAFYVVCLVNLHLGVVVFGRERALWRRSTALPLLACGLAAVALMPRSEVIPDIVARRLAAGGFSGQVAFHRDDVAAAVTGVDLDDGKHLVLLNGIIVSGSGRAGSLMGHIPLLLHEAPSRALVVCLGFGNTFRAAVDQIGRTDVVELVGGVVASFARFHADAERYLRHPEVRVFVNDGRNHMLVSRDEYDAIVVDASPPIFSAGTVNLYSLEFLRLARERLTPAGIMALWVPTPCFERDFWMITRNFADTFPHLFAWTHPKVHGVLLMGSGEPIDGSPERFGKRLRESGLPENPRWLSRAIYEAGWALSDAELRGRAAGFPLVTDDRPRTEFPLGALLAGQRLERSPEFVLRAKH